MTRKTIGQPFLSPNLGRRHPNAELQPTRTTEERQVPVLDCLPTKMKCSPYLTPYLTPQGWHSSAMDIGSSAAHEKHHVLQGSTPTEDLAFDVA